MSTYTDLHTRIRENLTILRRPGSPEDGLTPQRVIFANPENIYEGTFRGNIDAVSASFTTCNLTDCIINGGKIIDATIYSDGQEIPVAELTTNVSELQEELSSTNENVNIALSACNMISIDLTSLSTSVSTLSSSLEQNSISTLAALSSCKELDKRIDDLISGDSGIQKISAEVISVLSTAVDGCLSSISSSLCSTIDNKLTSLESSLESQIEKVSSDFNSFIESDFAEACISIGSEASRRHANEQYLSGEISSNTEQILQIKDCIKGGLVYSGTLSVDEHTTTLWELIRTNDEDMPLSTVLKAGFFYVINASSKVSSYNVEGVELEHGDWMLINEDVQLSNVASAQIDVLDAQDYDNFKLGDDNTTTGDNTFTGSNVFTGSTTFNGTQSFDNGTVVFGDACTAAFRNGAVVNGSVVVSGDAKFYANTNFYSLVDIEAAKVESLSLQLSTASYATKNGNISSLDDLTSSIDSKFDSTSLSIASISAELLNAARYFGTLQKGYTEYPRTLSGFLDENLSCGHDYVLQKGYLYRIANDISINLDGSQYETLHTNDFVMLNKEVILKNIVWQDVDIIRSIDADYWMSMIDSISAEIDRLTPRVDDYEQSICVLRESIDTVETSAQTAIDNLDEISTYVHGFKSNYSLESNNSISIVTALAQNAGKVELSARELLSSDVKHLDGFVQDVANNYLPLSGGQLNGELCVQTINVAFSSLVDNQTLCSLAQYTSTLTTEVSSANARIESLSSTIQNALSTIESDAVVSSLTDSSDVSTVIYAVVKIRDVLLSINNALKTN